MEDYLTHLLTQRQQASLYRTRQVHDSPQSPYLTIDGQRYLSFCSNDYLGLANHPQIKADCQAAIDAYGVGSGASHLVNGHTTAHHALENTLAHFTHRESALLFSTGYMANLGVLTGLLGREDAIFLDKLNHASLVDAALLSRANIYRYPHNDIQTLERLLAKSKAVHKMIVTDGVFSMDGDIAHLPAICDLAAHYHAWVMVDDAHGLGVVGETGRGSLEVYNLDVKKVPVLVGTLGKAFGVFGAFVAGSSLLTDALIQMARTYIYTTALPPALAVALQTSAKLVEQEAWRRQHLHELVQYFRTEASYRGIALTESTTPIQPIILGESEKALQVSHSLYEKHIWVTAIRPPTVPKGSARLRITLSANHERAQVDELLMQLEELL